MSLTVTLLGTGSGIPQPGRSQSALLIRDKGLMLLFDCGAGTLNRLTEAGISPEDIDSVFLTHLHLDHIADLLPLLKARWLMDTPAPTVFGPVGTERWLRATVSLYPYLSEMRVKVRELVAEEGISVDSIEVSTAETVHSVVSLGYRIDGSASVVYSGDTEATPNIAELADGSDILVHECSFPEGFDVTNHSTPKKLAENLGDVARAVLTHFYPQCSGREDEMATQVSEGAGVPVVAGRDRMIIES